MVKYAVIYNYLRTGKVRRDGMASILIRAYLKGQNKFFNTGASVRPSQWDNNNHRVINHLNKADLNKQIRNQLEKMEAYEFQVINQEGSITLDRLAQYESENISQTFTAFYRQQLDESKLAPDSYTDQRQTLHKLLDYGKEITFSSLTYKLIQGFDHYLFKSGLSVNTVAKHHKNIKKYINQSIRFGYLDANDNPYKQFKVKREPTERAYLTELELSELEALVIPKEKDQLQQVKDFFLFCCYTGLRYSDASRLTVENLHVTEGKIELRIKAQKTKKTLSLPLEKLFGGKPERMIRRYLEQYSDFYYDDPENPMPIFFGWTNQYINRELKTLAQLAGFRAHLRQSISVHSARHTFGTIMAGKVETPVLQKLMQHSKIKETMIYVHLNQESINKMLDNIKW